jgi:glycosyltransferase involved in cell wall biosynthesis
MSTDLVTIVLPVHGKGIFLRQALESIRSQSDFNLIRECIIVCDRVEQNDKNKLMEEFSENFWRFTDSPKPGIVSALNLGISFAETNLIARMDADDIMHHSRISRQIIGFRENPQLVLLGTQIQEIDIDGNFLSERKFPLSDEVLRQKLKRQNVFVHPTVMFRRDTFMRAGGYREFYECAEDYDLWLRMAKYGHIANLDSTLLMYRIHPDQVSFLQKRKQLIAECAARVSNGDNVQEEEDPANNFKNLDDWWLNWSNGVLGKRVRIIVSLRLKITTTKSRGSRFFLLLPLALLNPSLILQISRDKLKAALIARY